MRLIDADALMDQIKSRECKNCDDYYGIRCRACATDDALYDIDNAPTVDRWISVKDRLPEIGKVVLAFGTRSATTGMFQGASSYRPDIWMWKNHTPKHVSHWMPLPEPPKEDDDGQTDRC